MTKWTNNWRGFIGSMAILGLVACGGATSGGYSASSGGGSPPTTPSSPPPSGSVLSVSLSGNPIFVGAGGPSMLTWSTTNATSCTASGGWSGAKPMSGSATVGPISATTTYTLTCTGTDGSTKNRSMTVNMGQAPTTNGLTMATITDERASYTKWLWTADTSTSGGGFSDPCQITEPIADYTTAVHNSMSSDQQSVHGDLEADDLWTYLMMYRRTLPSANSGSPCAGNSVYLNRAQAWLSYYKNEYRLSSAFAYDGGFLYDHMFGWGLVTWYEHTCQTGTCDTAALAEAEQLLGVVESYWSTRINNNYPVPGQFSMAFYSLRQGARHLLLATRVAEATNNPRWITLRDRLIDIWLQSPDWDSRGMYFLGDYQTNNDLADNGITNTSWAAGARMIGSFQIGVLAEAFWHAYRNTADPAHATQHAALSDKLVAMANFVDQYGLDAACQYTSSELGIVNGQPWQKYKCSSTDFWDPVYTTALVNTLVTGYKLTGDSHFYCRAQYFFNRGTKGIYGSSTQRETADNKYKHMVDTKFATATANVFLDYNKGELQYTYLLFENGGQAVSSPCP